MRNYVLSCGLMLRVENSKVNFTYISYYSHPFGSQYGRMLAGSGDGFWVKVIAAKIS